MTKSITVTREDLYALVWETPVSKLAEQFQISDRGLAKKCIKHKIPRPSLGYWAKIASGKKVKKIKLPTLKDKSLATVIFYISSEPSESKGKDNYIVPEELLLSAKKFEFPKRVNSYHSIIQEAKSHISTTPDKYGRIYALFSAIKVSKQNLPRAFMFLEGLVRLMDTCGWSFVKVTGRYGHQSSYLPAFSDGNSELIIEIKEIVKRSENTKKPSDRVFWYERYSYSPTGKLQFSIVNVFSGGFQKTWGDNSKNILEANAESIIASFAKAFQQEKIRKQKSELEQIERQKRHQAHEEKLRRQEQEQERLRLLIEAARKHKEANDIRLLIESVSRSGGNSQDVLDWIALATTTADKHDPVNELEVLLDSTLFRDKNNYCS